jgi:hypothetical protein
MNLSCEEMEPHHIPKQIIICLEQDSLDIQNHGGGINLFSQGQNESEGPLLQYTTKITPPLHSHMSMSML